MNRSCEYTLCCALFLALFASDCRHALAQTGTREESTGERPEQIAVSFRALKGKLHLPIATFHEMTRVYGFLLAEDKLGKDCILVGAEERDRPLLRVDDFAVAYQNVTSNRQRPACSIDPRQGTMKQLTDLMRSIMSSPAPSASKASRKEFERLACSPQDVSVFGVDPATHLAKVMVDTDYHLKTVVNGAERIEGIKSLSEILIEEAERQVRKSGRLAVPMQVGVRFWFNSGDAPYRTDGKLFLICRCPVVLRTEEEAITASGGRVQLGRPNPHAKQFADALTTGYKAIAKLKPRYRELENVYRFVAVADLLSTEAERFGFSSEIEHMVEQIRVHRHQCPETLPGRYRAAEAKGTIGAASYYLWMPTCGGVLVDVNMSKAERETDRSARFAGITNTVLAARPDPHAVGWVFYSQALAELVD